MTDGAIIALLGAAAGAAWTWFIVRATQAGFAAEREQHVRERGNVLRVVGQYETKLREYERMTAGIPPEEM